MCFSAEVSFGAGAVLTVIGVATIKKTQHSSQLLFASIPFIFGMQQIAEGILWLSLPNPDYLNVQTIFTYVFLFFAQILWPLWVPVAILLLEKESTRKNIQKVLVGAGLLVGAYLAYCLLFYRVEAKIVGQHIMYLQDYPVSFRNYGIILYALATIVPPFFSHIKNMWLLGVIILLSYVIAAIFYEHYVLSVWCFFASIISLSILFIIFKLTKEEKLKSVIQNSSLLDKIQDNGVH
jgi:hypothetical protein